MTDKKHEEEYKPYKPEHPADSKTLKKEREEIREAAKHAVDEGATSKETDDEEPVSREQAEKELHDAVRKVQQEKKHK